MNTPSRREFFSYAAAATLVSALPASAQTKKGSTLLPLVVDVIGPIACRWSGTKFELWMPDLSTQGRPKGITPHEAGIKTTVTSFELPKDDYQVSFDELQPASSAQPAEPYSMGQAKIFLCNASNTSAANRYIYVSLPMPHCISALDPVSAKIYRKQTAAPSRFDIYAGGVRLFYNHAGNKLTLKGSSTTKDIELDPAPCEMQSNILIGYVPHDCTTDHAQESFRAVSELFSLDLDIEVNDKIDVIKVQEIAQPIGHQVNYFRPCRTAVIGVA